MRGLLVVLLAPCALAVLVGLMLLTPSPEQYRPVADQVRSGQGAPGLGAQTPVDGEVVGAAGEVDCTDPNLPSPGPLWPRALPRSRSP